MRENHVKRTLAGGGVALGTSVFEFSSTGIARIASAAGADFIFFDMEHTGWGLETIRMLMATCPPQAVPIVRPPANQYHLIAGLLDVGAMGIMIPMVETPEQARQMVQSAKYPPFGRRGAAFGFAHDDYRGGDVAEKIRGSNQEVLLIALIETATGIENLEAIAAVDGIDVLWIGHFDLTNSLGIPAQFEHPRFVEAVDRLLAICLQSGKAAGMMASDVDHARALLTRGFRCIAYSGDIFIYQQALAQALAAIRAGLPELHCTDATSQGEQP
jgi:2-dehydro-3-deoxyglucarate aldolase/4-hydroxy-2-oxoheptanedioate aldolase